jgi:hypothetical protein
MRDSKFKTMRHIETVRNYINWCINELMIRQEQHDQTKLQSPEVEIFEEYTDKLRATTYGSDEYKENMKEMKVAIDHHQLNNRHHPEYFGKDGILGMNLIDLLEMMCDWKSATMRHNDGDIMRSIKLNKERFKYSDELESILINTAKLLNEAKIYHKADES